MGVLDISWRTSVVKMTLRKRERERPDLAMSSHTADSMVQQLENSIKLAVLAPRTIDTVFLVTDGHRVHDALKTKVNETKHLTSVNTSRGKTEIWNFREHLTVPNFPLMGRLYDYGVSVRVGLGC